MVERELASADISTNEDQPLLNRASEDWVK